MDSDWDDFIEFDKGDKEFTLVAARNHQGIRLDHFLADHLPTLSRSKLTGAIKKGDILLNDQPAKASRKLQVNDIVTGKVEITDTLELIPQQVDFEILYEDEYLIGISKPPGLVVHPASGNPDKTLVNGLLYYCGTLADVGDPVRPGIVHRLDKDTSGAMVVAKDHTTHMLLVEAFKSRRVEKKYHTLVGGVPREGNGRIVAPIGRHPVNRKKMAVCLQRGKHAATRWRVLHTFKNRYSYLEIDLETGRTHQIRVHLASIGLPVAGDTVYGGDKNSSLFPRQMLHSSMVRLLHPITSKKLTISAPAWHDITTACDTLKLES